ncbi:hypothetical protein HK44_028545 [Pseudomonas fluorescens HK44]|uniref:Uncharacterized protein n=1 Tax=Pseudomonas fluorescens HK44 TaxID=1042209 RepID=A0A010TCH0_PSEFL|nr:hypothetical protein HK44_028545 [Pseudomonas fluorescens HK44]
MRGGTLLAFIQEKPGSIAGHGAKGEQGRTGRRSNVAAIYGEVASLVGAAAGCDLLASLRTLKINVKRSQPAAALIEQPLNH